MSGSFSATMTINRKWITIDIFLVNLLVILHQETGARWRFIAMAARTDPVELEAVYAMMAATGNSWASSIPDVCVKSGRWHGIECAQDAENQEVLHVVGLSFGLVTDETTTFPSCARESTIAKAVANLTHLRKLSYFSCCTKNPQPIPREIGQLGATLETLHLRNNGHVGLLVSELAKLTKLRILDVHRNYLTGRVPVWLSSLTELQLVDMSGNAFQGQVEASIFPNLEKLVILDASANRLSGRLSDSIGRLGALKKLDLSFNNFSGSIPASLGNLGSLLYLNLAHNAFTGRLPETLGDLSSLTAMDLHNNSFQAPIPSSFGKLRNLEGLILSGAQFSGLIPSSLGSLPNLRALFLDCNKLTGPIPPALGNLTHVYEIELSSNLLEGPVPFSQGFIARLGRRLRLQNNQDLCYWSELEGSSTRAQGSTIPAAHTLQLRICSDSKANRRNITVPEDPPPARRLLCWIQCLPRPAGVQRCTHLPPA